MERSFWLTVNDVLLGYFEVQSKTKSLLQLSEREETLLSSIVNWFRMLGQQLKSDFMLDKSQIIVVLPPEWDGEQKYKEGLLELLLKTGWITDKDGRYKLIFAPFIETTISYLYNGKKSNIKFDRERKSLLFYTELNGDTSECALNVKQFQMQSAKELTTISKGLAATDFLLVPTIKDIKSTSLDLKTAIHDSIDRTIGALCDEYQVVGLQEKTCETMIKKLVRIYEQVGKIAHLLYVIIQS